MDCFLSMGFSDSLGKNTGMGGYVFLQGYIHTCIYIYMCVCIFIHTHTHTHIYIYIWKTFIGRRQLYRYKEVILVKIIWVMGRSPSFRRQQGLSGDYLTSVDQVIPVWLVWDSIPGRGWNHKLGNKFWFGDSQLSIGDSIWGLFYLFK